MMWWYLCQPSFTNSVVFIACFSEVPPSPGLEKKKKRHLTSGKIKALEVCRSDCHGVVTEFLFLMILSCSPNINCQRSNLSASGSVVFHHFDLPIWNIPKMSKVINKFWKSQNLAFPYQNWFSVILQVLSFNKCRHWGISAVFSNATDTRYKNSSSENIWGEGRGEKQNRSALEKGSWINFPTGFFLFTLSLKSWKET